MSTASHDVLSREELAALLASVEDRRRRALERNAYFAPKASAQGSGERDRRPSAGRACDSFCEEFAKELSSRFQSSISLELFSWEALSLEDFIDSLGPHDVATRFRHSKTGESGWILLNRPLAFGWLALAFGARAPIQPEVPSRDFTRIERAFVGQLAGEVLQALSMPLGEVLDFETAIAGVEDLSVLREAGSVPLSLASFEVRGLEDVCRLRVALPPACLENDAVERPAKSTPKEVLSLSVDVCAELGHAELSLAQIQNLAVGDVIPIEGDAEGLLSLCVEGTAKFKALRGRRGVRLAAQIVDRLPTA